MVGSLFLLQLEAVFDLCVHGEISLEVVTETPLLVLRAKKGQSSSLYGRTLREVQVPVGTAVCARGERSPLKLERM